MATPAPLPTPPLTAAETKTAKKAEGPAPTAAAEKALNLKVKSPDGSLRFYTRSISPLE